MKNRKKKTSRELKVDIIKMCWRESKNLEDLATHINSNWKTCEKYCQLLEKEGVLKSVIVSGKIVGYCLNQTFKDCIIDCLSLDESFFQIKYEGVQHDIKNDN